MLKVTLAICTNRTIQPKTAECLMRLVAHGGYDFHILVAENGYTIAENRNYVGVQALNNKSDYLFFVDDDMTFEPDYLDKMIAHNKDIIGGVYSPRVEGGKRQVFRSMDDVLDLREDVLEEVTQVIAKGTALMVINMRVFAMTRPWFEFTYDRVGMCTEGEDWFFCKKAGEHDFTTWVDPLVKVGHLGDITY